MNHNNHQSGSSSSHRQTDWPKMLKFTLNLNTVEILIQNMFGIQMVSSSKDSTNVILVCSTQISDTGGDPFYRVEMVGWRVMERARLSQYSTTEIRNT